MSKELKCPNCGSVFTVDEADYASIVSQVKTKEFDEEVSKRLAELKERFAAEQALDIQKKILSMPRSFPKRKRRLPISTVPSKRVTTISR